MLLSPVVLEAFTQTQAVPNIVIGHEIAPQGYQLVNQPVRFSTSSWTSQYVLVTGEVKDKRRHHPGSWLLLVVDYNWARQCGLSHHLSRPTLQLLQNKALRPGYDKNPLPAFWALFFFFFFTVSTRRPNNDRVIPDKPPQFTTVVSWVFSTICLLQRLCCPW